MTQHLRLGTRGSALALAQSRWVAAQLEGLGFTVALEIIRTTGDRITDLPLARIGTKGLFVSELEQALLDEQIDVAVHSMKDLPGEMAKGLILGAVPRREDPRDVLCGPHQTPVTLAELRAGALVGTSSLRRRAQLLAARPDLGVVDLRGNLDTRLRKLDEGQFDAICLAAAGLHRLGWATRISEYIDMAVMLPPAGQGALAIQVREADTALRAALTPLHDTATGEATAAERTVLAALGGGCSLPLGVLATQHDGEMTVTAALCTPDGTTIHRVTISGTTPPETLGRELADRLLARAGRHFPGLPRPGE